MEVNAQVRVLVAEDDAAQLKAMLDWLAMLRPSWKVVATASDEQQALQRIDEHAPDLLIIDIHLGGGASRGWIRSLPATVPIIFVTGDPNFALDAFDLQAVDYILKPVSPRRLRLALDRAAADPRCRALAVPVATAAATAAGALPGLASDGSGEGPIQWLTVSKGQEVLLVSADEIIYLQADLKYTRVVSLRGEGLVRLGISELCQRLASPSLVRIHRSVVVNLQHVGSVRRNDLGQLDVHLRGRPEVLRVSKTFQQVFRMN